MGGRVTWTARAVAVTLDLSCRDWEQRLRQGRSLVPDLVLPSPALGERAVKIFNKLRLADVPGTPTLAEAGGDWFRDIVRAMFGALDQETKERLIRELFCLVPKKNAKTTYGALGLMLVALLLNERPRAQLALMAPVQDTAEEAFEAAAGAIALDPVLDKKFHVRAHLKTIVHRETKADLQIFTFDPDVLTGKKFVYSLIDELHVVAKNAKASKAIRQVRGGTLPFPEGFLAFITTMPDDQPVGEMKAELQKAREVRDGERMAKTLAVLYEFPRSMQASGEWRDPATWSLVNPNANRSVNVPRLKELYEDALAKGEAELRGWASQHLNLEVGLALTSNSWAGAGFWEACAVEGGLTFEQLIERCDVATAGIDGGGLDDLLGLYVLGRDRETRAWLGWGRAWAHKIVLERRKEIAAQLLTIKEDGDLIIVEHIGDDIDELADIMERLHEAGLFDREEDEEDKASPAIGVDPAGIGAVVEAIVARGVPQAKIIGISQGWKMTGAVKTAERRVAEGTLLHGGQRLMSWCVANARVEPRGNAIVITKQASGSAKIDPLMALFNAVSLMSLLPEAGDQKPQLFFV